MFKSKWLPQYWATQICAYELVHTQQRSLYIMVISSKQTSNLYYSRVHVSWNEIFSKILKKPSIVQK